MLRIVYILTLKLLGVCAPQICSVVDDGEEAAREYTCAMGDGGVDSTPPSTPPSLLLFHFIFSLAFQALFAL